MATEVRLLLGKVLDDIRTSIMGIVVTILDGTVLTFK